MFLESYILNTFNCSFVKITMHLNHTDSDLEITSPKSKYLPGSVPQVFEFSLGVLFSGSLSVWSSQGILKENERRLLNEYIQQSKNSIERIILEEKTNRLRVLEESDKCENLIAGFRLSRTQVTSRSNQSVGVQFARRYG